MDILKILGAIVSLIKENYNCVTYEEHQLLLKKYQNLQSHINSLGEQFWISASIFVSITTAAAGWIVKSIILNGPITNKGFIMTLILSFVMIAILACVIIWLKRINTLIESNKKVSEKIEQRLSAKFSGFNLDDFKPSCYTKETISSRKWWEKCPLLFCLYVPKTGEYIGKAFFFILIAVWLSLIGYLIFLKFVDCF